MKKYILKPPNSNRNGSYIMVVSALNFSQTLISALAMAAGGDWIHDQHIDNHSHYIFHLGFVLAAILQ